MNGRVLQFGNGHHDVEVLLPWFVNGTLDDDDRLRVTAHLEDCTHCRGEVQSLRALQAEYAHEDPVVDSGPAFRSLRAQLQPPLPWHHQALQRLRTLRQPERWLPWAVALQLVLIAAIGIALFDLDPRAGGYRTLGAAGANLNPAGSIVVVFAPQTTEQELRAIVQAAHARIVDGPTATHAYVLNVDDANAADVLRSLHAQPAIVLAEPLQTGR